MVDNDPNLVYLPSSVDGGAGENVQDSPTLSGCIVEVLSDSFQISEDGSIYKPLRVGSRIFIESDKKLYGKGTKDEDYKIIEIGEMKGIKFLPSIDNNTVNSADLLYHIATASHSVASSALTNAMNSAKNVWNANNWRILAVDHEIVHESVTWVESANGNYATPNYSENTFRAMVITVYKLN